MKAEVQDSIGLVHGSHSKSLKQSLQKAVDELNAKSGTEDDCPHDSTRLSEDIKELKAKGDTLLARIAGCDPNTIEGALS